MAVRSTDEHPSDVNEIWGRGYMCLGTSVACFRALQVAAIHTVHVVSFHNSL